MAEVAFSKPQGRIQVLFPDEMDMADVRDAIVNHMAVLIMAARALDGPQEGNGCSCTAIDSGAGEDFWQSYHCPIHGAETPQVSEKEIDDARSPSGGWSRETLEKWGVPWPPPKGWRADLIRGARADEEAQDNDH